MKRMKNIEETSFSRYYDAKNLKKEISNASIGLIIPGTALALIALMKSFVCEGFAWIVCIAAAVCGLALIILGTFFPQRMLPVTKKLSAFLNKIGVFILRALLVPIYLLTYITTFWYAKKKNREYAFIKWEEAPPVQPSFFEKEVAATIDERKAFGVVGSIFADLSAHKAYILLPMVLVLLLIGLLFFFISSSTVFSFIYTFV